MPGHWRVSAFLGLAWVLFTEQLCAQVAKDIRIESQPPGATIELLVGTKREPIGQTPLTYHAEFHSEISVLRFSAEKPGYVAREFEVAGKDDHAMIELQERSFAASPADLNDPELGKMQEQMVAVIEKVIRDALKEQSPFEVDVAKNIAVQRIDGSAYLVVPVSVGHAPADYRQVSAGNAPAFLADLWSQLGEGFALPLMQAARKVKGINGIVLDADYSHVQPGFSAGLRMKSTVEMECQPDTIMVSGWDPCATREFEGGLSTCVGGPVQREVYFPCARMVPVTHTALAINPRVSFAQANSKARYIGSLEAFGTAVHAKDVYEQIGAVLTDNKGSVLVRHGELPASLAPQIGTVLTDKNASVLARQGDSPASVAPQAPEEVSTQFKQNEKACDNGDATACNLLALMYLYGTHGVKEDDAKGAQFFKKACDGGDAGSCYDLGIMYDGGTGVQKDKAKAAQLYKKACDGDDAAGCAYLGSMYKHGEGGLPKDEAKAAQLDKKACDGGSAMGCTNLGSMYQDGEGGLPKDEVKAAQLYKKACDGDEANGCFDLGLAYYHGRGAPQDDSQVVHYFEKACDGDVADACANLGGFYKQGTIVKKDAKKAQEYFDKAHRLGE